MANREIEKNESKLNRRTFLKYTITASTLIALGTRIDYALGVSPQNKPVRIKYTKGNNLFEYEHTPKPEKKYGMVIDCERCIGCRLCAVACRQEFDVPKDYWRAWVKIIESDQKEFYLPRLCMHCENAPCVNVCPVKAAYKREDGVVLTDYDRCIGCKYCIIACPYDARFIHPIHKVSDKCTFCDHRIEIGLKPACVDICPVNARIFGDLNDPNSEISKLLISNPVKVLREEMGTRPKVYYINPPTDISPTEDMARAYSRNNNIKPKRYNSNY